jgi:hypothetical protein
LRGGKYKQGHRKKKGEQLMRKKSKQVVGILLSLVLAIGLMPGMSMTAKAEEGLRQIEEKAYLAEFQAQGISRVWKYGVAFCGKRVWMERG